MSTVSPFTFGKIAEGESFTNRNEELRKLKQNVYARTNTTIISPRRWGKSSLVKKLARELQQEDKKIVFCFIDLFTIRTEAEFFEVLAKEVLKATSDKWDDILQSAKQFFSKIVPKFTMGLDPMHDFTISMDWEEVRKAPEEILHLPENISKGKNIQLVICLDEFQNISLFDENAGFQKKLRAHWQHHQQVTYLLYGSKKNMMIQLFDNSSNPFYRFGELIFLEKISTKHWVEYITWAFQKTGKTISDKNAALIAEKMENHPYFVQHLAQLAWYNTQKKCTEKIIEEALNELLNQYSPLFIKEINGLTNTQINFLKALSDGVDQLSAAKTLKKYQIGTSANVLRIKAALENKEIIDTTGLAIEWIDPPFKLWFKRVYQTGY
jgi:AAA+ ATPase superfamily predicted ATPase